MEHFLSHFWSLMVFRLNSLFTLLLGNGKIGLAVVGGVNGIWNGK